MTTNLLFENRKNIDGREPDDLRANIASFRRTIPLAAASRAGQACMMALHVDVFL